MEQVEVSSEVAVPTPETVMTEVKEVESVGNYTGQCKWFNDKLGYGFVTICDGDDKGKDIFVHHSGINPLNSNYKTLRKGEYIQFNVIDGMNGLQAVNVRGIGGGPLMCDFVSTRKASPVAGSPTHGSPQPRTGGKPTQWQTVTRKAKYAPKSAQGGYQAQQQQGEGYQRPTKRSYRQAMTS